MKDVSVLLVNYKTPEMTLECIKSILKNTKKIDYEIIVVDNGSADNSIDYLNEWLINYDNIIILDAKENLGFGKANNLAASYASGKYLFLLNNDTILIDNPIKEFFDFMEKIENLQIGVCGGNLLDINQQPAHSYNVLPDIAFEKKNAYKFITNMFKKSSIRSDYNYTDNIIEVGYITGADFFIRKSVFEQLGGFDKDFFMYSEESELCFRIKKAGYFIVNIPYVKIIHLEGQSVKSNVKFNEKRFRMFCEGRFIYYNKTYGAKIAKKVYRILRNSYLLKYLLSFFDKKYIVMMRVNKKTYIDAMIKLGGKQ